MKRILLIEDNLDVRENTQEMLELANYTVETAENGKIGVELAKSWDPDLIVCDIMMPVLDGYGVLFMLSKDPATRNIPFIFLTAKAEKTDFRKGMAMGADDYLTKPFEEMELLEAIERRLEKSAAFSKGFGDNAQGLDNFIAQARGLEELENLSENRRVREYRKKEIIYREGDYAGAVILVISGKVKTYRINDDAKEYITGLYKAGEYIGYGDLLQGEDYKETAAVLEDSSIVKLPREDFLKLIHNNRDVADRFIKMLANQVGEKEERLVQLAYDSVRKRVADALILLQDKYSEHPDKKFKMAISRDDLASVVGTSTESVIRTLSGFKSDGYVAMRGSDIEILDAQALRDLRW